MRDLAAVRLELGHEGPISADEAVHVARRISRRRFLRLGAAAGAGVVLAACTGDRSSRRSAPRLARESPAWSSLGPAWPA